MAPIELHHAVVDASAIVDFLVHRRDAVVLRNLVEDPLVELHVPKLCDIEATSGIRRALLRGKVQAEEATSMLRDLRGLPLERYEHGPLLNRVLELRDNFSAYDAAYVALAEALGTSLITADSPLYAAVKTHTDVVAHLVAPQ